MADSIGNLIYIGSVESPIFAFDDDSIFTISLNTSVDVTGQEMNADTFETEVFCDDSDETLRNIPWATAIYYYVKESQKGKFYITKVTRTGRTKYSIEATSAIGVLDYENFYGGIYNGENFDDVVDSILWTNGLSKYSYIYGGIHRGICGDEYYTTQSSVKYIRYMNAEKMQFTTGSISPHRVQTSFTINRCLLNDYNFYNIDKSGTSVRLYLFGWTAGPNNDSTLVTNRQCGVYMDMTRANANADWPDFGKVYLQVGATAYLIGDPSLNSWTNEYDIDITYKLFGSDIPGTIIVNNTEYTMDENASNPTSSYIYYAGGVMVEGNTTTVPEICCDITYNKFIFDVLTSSNPVLGLDIRAVKDSKEGLKIFNFAEKYYGEVNVSRIYWAEGDETGSYKLFNDGGFITDIDTDLTYADEIDKLPVYGWLPVCTKREALHQLMFSRGVSLIKSAKGGLIFTKLVNTLAGDIPDERLYMEGSEEYLGHTNLIEITEHSFVDRHEDPEVSEEVIYENQIYQGEDFYYAVFEKSPSYMTTVSEDFRWYFQNCNAALVTGRGTINGFPYMHGQKVRTRKIGEYADGKSVSVSNVPLITLQNSELLADRMEAYYGHAHKIQNAILVDGEHCGLRYEFSNPFGEETSGFLAKMNQNVSSIIKGDCEFVVGYNAANSLNGFNHYVVLTGSGTWTVPASVFQEEFPRIRVVLVGGGNGGASGFAGEDGVLIEQFDSGATAAKGGDVGESGNPGKVHEVLITNPASTLSYSCGVGGAGGEMNASTETNNPGSAGGDTTITIGGVTHTSSNGNIPTDGYYNFFTGDAYAKHVDRPLGTGHLIKWGEVREDVNGVKLGYGKGGEGGTWVLKSYTEQGMTFTALTQQYGGYAASETTQDYQNVWYPGWFGTQDPTVPDNGGAGGGAAYGSAGETGGDGSTTKSGDGGNGADAIGVPVKPTTYNPLFCGYGGCGGAGGGGGGSSGAMRNGYAGLQPADSAGKGGKGGKGGDGGDGCVLIYY